MCCLFGIIDYKQSLSKKQINRIISTLSVACEARGTDATGISYNTAEKLCIFKRPLPAHRMHFYILNGVHAVMGHTRMTTQGNERRNYNNHPFIGYVNGSEFALAHNGVLYNDIDLQRSEVLPKTKIETDSYVAVQLIEKYGELSFEAFRYAAELLVGSYTLTVMDQDNNFYFVKGDNPMCIYHYKDLGVYLYASTEEILKSAIYKMPYNLGVYEKLNIECGTILKIDNCGEQSTADFKFSYQMKYYDPYWMWRDYSNSRTSNNEYVKELKSAASGFGVSPEDIDELLAEGFTTDDIEEFLYCGQF